MDLKIKINLFEEEDEDGDRKEKNVYPKEIEKDK